MDGEPLRGNSERIYLYYWKNAASKAMVVADTRHGLSIANVARCAVRCRIVILQAVLFSTEKRAFSKQTRGQNAIS